MATNVSRVRHTTPCTDCGGDGAITTNASWRNDPQCEETHDCRSCNGDGFVVLWTDPLARLKQARQHARASWGALPYGQLRQVVVSPVLLP